MRTGLTENYSNTLTLAARCVGTNRGGTVEEGVSLDVLEEGLDSTAIIAGSTAAGHHQRVPVT